MWRSPKESRSRSRQRRTLHLVVALVMTMCALSTAFSVTRADPPNRAPSVEWFVISEGPLDLYSFFGYVSDPDGSTEGYVVQFGGAVESYGISATVGPDGSFDEVFSLPGAESGIVTADTQDPQGAASETAMTYLYVTP